MYKIQTLNNISPTGLDHFPRDHYEVASEIQHPDAILLRSFNMHNADIPETVRAVGRAGAGVNNVPIDKLSQRGIPVFNTPGANANAVKELVLAGMFIACRNICQGWHYARELEGDDKSLNEQVEKGKKNFVGFELPGRTLGVIGLGAIGVQVANAAIGLGMNVIGYDPHITVRRAWELSADVQKAENIEEVFTHSDMMTFHVPLNEETKGLVNTTRLKSMRDGVVLLNFSRAGIVDEDALCEALVVDKVYAYVCDFPSNRLKAEKRVIALPHLGASTKEAEENCARMVVKQMREFLENGNIRNSVNFPEVYMPRSEGEDQYRLAIANANVPNMVGQISTCLADAGLNIIDLLNKSRGEVAYTLLDVNAAVGDNVVAALAKIKGVLNVWVV